MGLDYESFQPSLVCQYHTFHHASLFRHSACVCTGRAWWRCACIHARSTRKTGRAIALYPDDLIAITLPATTYPLDVVKAQRFLDARKADPKAPEDKSLADPVVKLLNYPVIVR